MSRLADLAKRPLEKLRPEQPAPVAKEAPEEPKKMESKELTAQRDRLLEKFTVMQADLGGAFYEMAIRDRVRLDVLTRKAAELQRVDAELTTVERLLELERSNAAGHCPTCGSPFGHGVRFCNQCGSSLFAPPPAAPLTPTPAPAAASAPAVASVSFPPSTPSALPEPPPPDTQPPTQEMHP